MDKKDFSITFTVDQSPEEVFEAINNVRGWWSEGIEEETNKLNDEFIYRHKDLHYSKQRLIEVIPGKRIVWLITESSLSFIKQKDEWNGTTVTFEIDKKGNKTQVTFTHVGLVPEFECFDACSGGWNYYLHKSLEKLITTGKGEPDKKINSTTKELKGVENNI
jgi:uncharacterized protein YndB with AHSA1/START domain